MNAAKSKLLPAVALLALAGCHLPGLNAHGIAAAWDNMRCDRRVGVFVNLHLDTEPGKKDAGERCGKDDYIRTLAYFHSRGVSEVVFAGRTTVHGSIGEFRALNDGFSQIPDPAYRRGRATIVWPVKRTYRFAPEDALGKYHPRTFWLRVFGSEWTDSCIDPSAVRLPPTPVFLVRNYYGSRCRVQQVAYVTHEKEKNGKKQQTKSWDVVREWDD